jgi:hypothetical protein
MWVCVCVGFVICECVCGVCVVCVCVWCGVCGVVSVCSMYVLRYRWTHSKDFGAASNSVIYFTFRSPIIQGNILVSLGYEAFLHT